MEKHYVLVFDDVMIKQLQKVAKNQTIKNILIKMLNKLEAFGPLAGELLDSQLFIYELKNKSPPIRLYCQHIKETDEINVFEFEMKTSQVRQQRTINRLRRKVSES